jgi:hypothetical protein
MEASAFTSAPDTNHTGLIIMTHGAIVTTVTLMNIGGTGGIIATITIGIEALIFKISHDTSSRLSSRPP